MSSIGFFVLLYIRLLLDFWSASISIAISIISILNASSQLFRCIQSDMSSNYICFMYIFCHCLFGVSFEVHLSVSISTTDSQPNYYLIDSFFINLLYQRFLSFVTSFKLNISLVCSFQWFDFAIQFLFLSKSKNKRFYVYIYLFFVLFFEASVAFADFELYYLVFFVLREMLFKFNETIISEINTIISTQQ